MFATNFNKFCWKILNRNWFYFTFLWKTFPNKIMLRKVLFSVFSTVCRFPLFFISGHQSDFLLSWSLPAFNIRCCFHERTILAVLLSSIFNAFLKMNELNFALLVFLLFGAKIGFLLLCRNETVILYEFLWISPTPSFDSRVSAIHGTCRSTVYPWRCEGSADLQIEINGKFSFNGRHEAAQCVRSGSVCPLRTFEAHFKENKRTSFVTFEGYAPWYIVLCLPGTHKIDGSSFLAILQCVHQTSPDNFLKIPFETHNSCLL